MVLARVAQPGKRAVDMATPDAPRPVVIADVSSPHSVPESWKVYSMEEDHPRGTRSDDQSEPRTQRETPESGRRRRDWVNELVQVNFPEADDPDRSKRNRKLLWSAAGIALAGIFTFGLSWATAGLNSRHQKQIEDTLDRQGPAFSATVRQSPPKNLYALAFNKPFTITEKLELFKAKNDKPALEKFIKSHNGNKLGFPNIDVSGFSEAWHINLLGDRKASLVITGMTLKGLKCKPAAANTVLIEQSQGVSDYVGMIYDLINSPTKPLITDINDTHWRQPFFEYKRITLGNGAEPAGLRVEVTSGFQDCTWDAFETTYVDATGTHKQDITNHGKKYAVHGVAKRPEQVYSLNPVAPLVSDCMTSPGGIYDCGYPGWQHSAGKQEDNTRRLTVEESGDRESVESLMNYLIQNEGSDVSLDISAKSSRHVKIGNADGHINPKSILLNSQCPRADCSRLIIEFPDAVDSDGNGIVHIKGNFHVDSTTGRMRVGHVILSRTTTS